MSHNLPVEILTFDFLTERIAVVPDDSILHGIELHDTLYQKITTPLGVRIGNARSTLAPAIGGAMKEMDASLIVVCYAEITGANKTERRTALTSVFQISQAITEMFESDETMGGRVCRTRMLEGLRDWDSITGKPYAVCNLPLIFNETGD